MYGGRRSTWAQRPLSSLDPDGKTFSPLPPNCLRVSPPNTLANLRCQVSRQDIKRLGSPSLSEKVKSIVCCWLGPKIINEIYGHILIREKREGRSKGDQEGDHEGTRWS